MKYASVYRRKDGWYFNAESKSAGALISTPPYFKLPSEAGCEGLGQAVITAFTGSLDDVPFPTDWESMPILAVAGVDSWGAFARNARCILIEASSKSVVILPFRRERANFFPLEDLKFVLSPDVSPEEIGEAVQRGISLCYG